MLRFYVERNRVILRIRMNRKGERVSLDYRSGLTSEGFDTSNQRYALKFNDCNDALISIEKAARGILNDVGINIDRKTFRSMMDAKLHGESSSFFAFAESWFNEMKERKTYLWAKQIQSCINLLKEFSPNVTFDKVDKAYHKRLLIFLNNKGYSYNTVGTVVKNLRRIIKEAAESGLTNNTAYLGFKRLQEDVESIYLSEVEIKKINDLELTPDLVKSKLNVKDVKKKITALDQARKLFLIGCWTGLRVGNYKNIDPTQIQGDYLTVIAIKGGDKLKIPLHFMVKEIVNSGWPKPMHEQIINKLIKDLGLLAGIDDEVNYYRTEGGKRKEYKRPKYELICTHTARRSFASNMLIRGVPTKYIMAITGHKTERDFNRYTASVSRDLLSEKIAGFGVW